MMIFWISYHLFLVIVRSFQCDWELVTNLVESQHLDRDSLQVYQYLLPQLDLCSDIDPKWSKLKNQIHYKCGLIQLLLGQEQDALNSFISVAESNVTSFRSLSIKRIQELNKKFGIWDNLVDDNDKTLLLKLNKIISEEIELKRYDQASLGFEELLKISPWSLEMRIKYNDILLDQLDVMIDINISQKIIENYQILLDKNSKILSLSDRLSLYYRISIIQLFILNDQPSSLKKCLNIDMDYEPCKQLMKIWNKLNKKLPLPSLLSDSSKYCLSSEYDWNISINFLQNDNPSALKTFYLFSHNYQLLQYLMKNSIYELISIRPLSNWTQDYQKKVYHTEFSLFLDVALCQGYDMKFSSVKNKFCHSAIKQVLTSEEYELLKIYITRRTTVNDIEKVLKKLFDVYPHLAMHTINLIIKDLTSNNRVVKHDDTKTWLFLQQFIKDQKLVQCSNKYLQRIFTIISRNIRTKQQYQQKSHFKPSLLDSKKDYYKILGIGMDSNSKEIRAAYLKLTKKFHPDKQGHISEKNRVKMQDKMSEINEAYEILIDNKKRKEYDRSRYSFSSNKF